MVLGGGFIRIAFLRCAMCQCDTCAKLADEVYGVMSRCRCSLGFVTHHRELVPCDFKRWYSARLWLRACLLQE